ncbi:BMC domain-containing protein [Clostridium sp. P21]|uniref:BMC domain-containing protein n=1 Tax=Clostridium muellerianum TaxID=2716538 RepID=A0A7Y0EI43_9CLOT|nr:BMC domain-containing protein [Clostridium muellerianum]NMM63801.1 BMC domain-containing protein [Clostridium muellerianum]
MNNGALGLIEVYGYLGAIEAADTALKAANVDLIGCEKVKGGIVTVKIKGDVGAVNSAVQAAEEAAKKISKLISTHVIARPDISTWSIVEKNSQLIESNVNDTQKTETIEDNDSICEDVIVEKVLNDAEENKNITCEKTEEVITEEIVNEDFAKELEKKTVEELRRLVRSMKSPMTNKQIKFARKDKLIQEILTYYKEE